MKKKYLVLLLPLLFVFNSCEKDIPDPQIESNVPYTLTVWSDSDSDIDVYINGNYVGNITTWFNYVDECGFPFCVTVSNDEEFSCHLYAENDDYFWEDDIIVAYHCKTFCLTSNKKNYENENINNSDNSFAISHKR